MTQTTFKADDSGSSESIAVPLGSAINRYIIDWTRGLLPLSPSYKISLAHERCTIQGEKPKDQNGFVRPAEDQNELQPSETHF